MSDDADKNDAPGERIRAEAKRISDASLLAAERHYAAETPWYNWNYILGVPSTILAALAGAAAFSKLNHSEIVAGSISIVVAILSSLTTFLDPHKKATAHHQSAKDYEALYHNAGFFYRVQSLGEKVEPTKLEQKLETLVSKLNELNRNSPAIPGSAYKIANQKIKENRGEVVRDPSQTPGI
jgi:hypothetical protein